MNKQEIIRQVVDNTNWAMMNTLRDLYMEAEYGKEYVGRHFNAETLKETGERILTRVVEEDINYCSTACLVAYKDEQPGYTIYGIRFEAESGNAMYYEEEDVLDME